MEDGHRLTLDDEEKATVFDIEGIRTATPDIVEYVPKSLSYSCMHMALSDINPPARADGLPAPLLAHEIGKVAFGISRRATRLVSLALKLLSGAGCLSCLGPSLPAVARPTGDGKDRHRCCSDDPFRSKESWGSLCDLVRSTRC